MKCRALQEIRVRRCEDESGEDLVRGATNSVATAGKEVSAQEERTRVSRVTRTESGLHKGLTESFSAADMCIRRLMLSADALFR